MRNTYVYIQRNANYIGYISEMLHLNLYSRPSTANCLQYILHIEKYIHSVCLLYKLFVCVR